jgi:hypothetical protein
VIDDRDDIGIVARVKRYVRVVRRLPIPEEVLDVLPRELMPTRDRSVTAFDASTLKVSVLTRRQDDHTTHLQPLSQATGLGDLARPGNAVKDD